MKMKKRFKNSKGFTLIELLLVVGIIGILLAIIIPKAIRANVSAKYGIVEKNASELKSFAVLWAEKSIRAQNEQTSVATLGDYYASLCATPGGMVLGVAGQEWIANTAANNWNLGTPVVVGGNPVGITGRDQGAVNDAPPEDTVEGIIPPGKAIRNPFNGVNVFRDPNLPTATVPVTGALALGYLLDSQGFYYFAFAFQGTDNVIGNEADDLSFYAGSGLTTEPAIRNGILFARMR